MLVLRVPGHIAGRRAVSRPREAGRSVLFARAICRVVGQFIRTCSTLYRPFCLPIYVKRLEAFATGEFSAGAKMANILIVDDDRINRLILEGLLVGAGHKVAHAADGLDAIQRLVAEEGNFDIALIDVIMPRCGGIELVRILRSQGLNLPCIACSGIDSTAEREHLLSSGFNDFIAKPVDAECLLAIVGKNIPLFR